MIVALIMILAGLVALWLAVVSHRNQWQRRLPPTGNLPARPAPVPRRAPVRANVPHLLYVYLWADSGRPAYFGISNEPDDRDQRHSVDPKDQWWYERTTKVMHEVAWYPDRVSARAAETATIGREALAGEYLANTHHNPFASKRRKTRA